MTMRFNKTIIILGLILILSLSAYGAETCIYISEGHASFDEATFESPQKICLAAGAFSIYVSGGHVATSDVFGGQGKSNTFNCVKATTKPTGYDTTLYLSSEGGHIATSDVFGTNLKIYCGEFACASNSDCTAADTVCNTVSKKCETKSCSKPGKSDATCESRYCSSLGKCSMKTISDLGDKCGGMYLLRCRTGLECINGICGGEGANCGIQDPKCTPKLGQTCGIVADNTKCASGECVQDRRIPDVFKCSKPDCRIDKPKCDEGYTCNEKNGLCELEGLKCTDSIKDCTGANAGLICLEGSCQECNTQNDLCVTEYGADYTCVNGKCSSSISCIPGTSEGDGCTSCTCNEPYDCTGGVCTSKSCSATVACTADETCIDSKCWCKETGTKTGGQDCSDLCECTDFLTCTNGKCTAEPTGCKADAECKQPGELCINDKCISGDCRTDNDCTGDDTCVDYECTPPECSTSDDCTDSAKPICSDNQCIAKPGGNKLGENQKCKTDADCKVGMVCILDDKIYTTCEFTLCKTQADCAPGSDCEDIEENTLKPLYGYGECAVIDDCTSDEECEGIVCDTDSNECVLPDDAYECTDDDECPTGYVCGEQIDNVFSCMFTGRWSSEGCFSLGGSTCTKGDQCFGNRWIITSGTSYCCGALEGEINPCVSKEKSFAPTLGEEAYIAKGPCINGEREVQYYICDPETEPGCEAETTETEPCTSITKKGTKVPGFGTTALIISLSIIAGFYFFTNKKRRKM